MVKMSDERQTREQLLEELPRLHQRVAELQKSEDQRLQAEEALRQSEAKYRALFNSIADPVFVFDEETKHFLDCNQAAIDRYGYTLDELRTMTPHQLHPPGELEVVERNISDEEKSSPHCYTHITKGGASLQVEVHTDEIDYQGRRAWISVVRDITGQRRAEGERERLLAALERRSTQLQTAAEVSRAVSSILESDTLIPQVVDLVRERFGLYYVGLFLVDQAGEWTGEPGRWAVLRAGTGEAGRQMLDLGHKLEISDTSMIGWCMANKQARVALDVGEDAVRFDNPWLPDTRSELALPLISRGRAVGALTIQSSQGAAFSEADITVLQTLADQLGNAIANARLYDQSQQEIAERTRAEDALTNRLRYEEGLAACSQALLADTAEALPGALPHLLAASDASRVYVFENFEDSLVGLCMRQIHEVCAPGVTPEIDNPELQHFPYKDGFARWQEKLSKGEPVVGLVEFFPRLEREVLEAQDILAILVLPIWVEGEWYGFIGFDDTIRRRQWNEEDIRLLQTAAGMVGAYIERKWAEKALRRAHGELEQYTDSLERQTAQLQVGAEVAREAAAILDVNKLLNTAVHLISERFGFYHAGAFLVDEQGEYAVLRAVSSEGGRCMLERGHKLQIGKVGIVGYVAAAGEPRIALDVGKDAAFFDNRDLPDTRSEMGLPLKVRGQVIGVLDVQSTQEAAFSEDDVAVLQTLADQLAVAVENARLVERTEAQLRELSRLYGEYSITTWAELTSSEHALSYVYDRVDVVPAESLPAPVLDLALERGETVALVEPEMTDAVLATPVRLRDQIIGTLGIQGGDGVQEWSPNEIALVEAVSEQVAQALENARLFAETQKSAQQMQVLNELGQALATRLNVEDVLEEAYGGASRLLDTTDFYIALYDPDTDSLSFPLATQDGQRVEWPSRQMGMGMTEYVVRGRQPVLVKENLPERLKEMGIEQIGQMSLSWLGVPLIVGDRVLGVMAVQSLTHSRAYDEHDRSLLMAIASQTAIAVQNAYLFEEAQRRATQLATAAVVARDATAILDVDQLLDETVSLISEQFGFYHAGVFLLDEQSKYAVLRAVSSEGGRRMLERGHRLEVGKVGIVGYVSGTGEPRISLDVGADATHFAHSDLPDTRSEMALPLKVRGQVIGVLDVQSTEEAAFSDEDVAVLQTLADQLAAAIVNARLFQEVRNDATRRALINEVQQAAAASLDPDELLHRAGEVISRRLLRSSAVFSWDSEKEVLRAVAVHDAQAADVPLADGLQVTRQMNPTLFSKVVDGRRMCVLDWLAPHLDQPAATLTERLGMRNGVCVPLTTRDQVLGVLALAQPQDHAPEEQDVVEVVGANLSVALENARLYQDAVETAKRLKEMDRLKSQFLANMSHELRTPLNSIIGFSRVILKGIDGPLTDMQRTDLQAVYDSGQHLLGLINDILDISKIQAGKMELSFEDVDLREVIKGVRSTAIALVKDKPIELRQSLPPDMPTIRADSRRIRQVLLNLVGNAAKFTEEGYIHIEAGASPSEVVISVTDSGIGIPPDKLETIFEEFTQVDGSSTRRAGGTGLGLSITRHFVEMHGGRIWVESTHSMGSTFYIALPIEGPSEKVDEERIEEVEGIGEEGVEEIGEGQKVVLCVDDNEGVITLFRRYLVKQGYWVVGLTDGTLVVEKARQLRPFAITLDVMMPDKDGWQVIQELKADPDTCHIPVIMCTIVGEEEHGLSLGASDYLLKPILEDDLVAALERLDPKDGKGEERHRVLVVDDQPGHRNLLRRMIETCERYEVVEAVGGQEAITLIRQTRPNVIILDLMMPGVDGFAVLEAVKADKTTRSIPIIVVTAKTLTQEERGILNKGVEALLQKGLFEQQELLADVAAVLEQIRTDGK